MLSGRGSPQGPSDGGRCCRRRLTPWRGETGPGLGWFLGWRGCRLGLRSPWTRYRLAAPSTQHLPLHFLQAPAACDREQIERAGWCPSSSWTGDRERALERLSHKCAVRRRPLTPCLGVSR